VQRRRKGVIKGRAEENPEVKSAIFVREGEKREQS
jgi:hypothetical protein